MNAAVAASLSTALAAWLVCRLIAPPPPRLAALIQAMPRAHAADAHGRLARALPGVAARVGGDSALQRRLRQAGMLRGRDPRTAAIEHCTRLAARGAAQGAVIALALLAAGARPATAAAGMALGAVAGGGRQHAALDRALAERRERMQIELYTVNQLLALDVRAGGGVAQALERTARRGEGVVAEEVRDLLATVRAGLPLHEALEQAATVTAEPAAARTYRLLSKGARFGTDLATALRALNEDLRVQRAEALERATTKRRAAMLLPIIGLLAPVMLLFVAAPLPSIVFGTR